MLQIVKKQNSYVGKLTSVCSEKSLYRGLLAVGLLNMSSDFCPKKLCKYCTEVLLNRMYGNVGLLEDTLVCREVIRCKNSKAVGLNLLRIAPLKPLAELELKFLDRRLSVGWLLRI